MGTRYTDGGFWDKNKTPDLPKGYKERMDVAVLNIADNAETAINIAQEFDCASLTLNHGDVEITIKKKG